MYILLIEDDYLTAESLIDELGSAFPKTDVKHCRTESEFLQTIDEIAAHPPKVVIMDVMVRWTDPSENMPPQPEEVQHNGPWRAGIRCERRLHDLNPKIPIVFYSVLDRDDLKDAVVLDTPTLPVTHLRKAGDVTPLIDHLRERFHG
jgi:DNA-binding NarL/FixJ family response regulator